MATGTFGPSVQLVPMAQLAEAKDLEEDNWTGLSDAAARRKRQNRLSKRAQRKRAAMRADGELLVNYRRDHVSRMITGKSQQSYSSDSPSPATSPSPAHETQDPLKHAVYNTLTFYNHIAKTDTRTIHSRPDVLLPLAADHLLTLIQFNLYRAFLINTALVSSSSMMTEECQTAKLITIPPLPIDIPSTLMPTALQKRIPHASWIDVFPLPKFRDNMIRAANTYDQQEFCLDMLGGLFYAHSAPEHSGLIVWSDPWNLAAWEVTEGFIRKWGFLLNGCEQLLVATNHWRKIRGEKALYLKY